MAQKDPLNHKRLHFSRLPRQLSNDSITNEDELVKGLLINGPYRELKE